MALKEIKYKTQGNTKYVVKSGPLFYSLQGADKALLRAYFLNVNNIERYMRLAKADSLLDIEVGDYQMVIEPMIRINRCTTPQSYKGAYTATEIGKLYKYVNGGITYNDTLKRMPGWLAISKETTIAGATYKPTWVVTSTGKARQFSMDEVVSNLGIGMAIINGKEVCGDKCKDSSQKYKIVYRTIDLNNPFLGADGNKRVLSDKSNWYKNEETIDESVYQNDPQYVVVLNPTTIKKIRESNKNMKYIDIISKYNDLSTFEASEFKKSFGL